MSKYLVTITAATRHGTTNLHTFGRDVDAELPWMLETHASRRQLAQRTTALSPFGVANWPPPPRRDIGAPLFDELGDGTLHLAPGVDVAAATLRVILDAVRSGGRHTLDLDGLKRVVSLHGSRIARFAELAELPEDDRRHAEAALYNCLLSVLY